jgi:DNA-binding MarR family transcriptional regulator
MIRNLRGLERQGWVRLSVGVDDRRRRLASLTAKGRAVFAAALPLWKEAQKEVGALLEEKLSDTNRRLVRLARSIS